MTTDLSPEISDLQDAIGRIETQEDVIDSTRLAQAAAMLGLGEDGEAAALAQGACLPPLFHLFYGNNTSDAGRLDHDGHEALGRFIPDVTTAGNFHRRMWAAGDMRFSGKMRTGERLKRQSTIRNIEAKTGKTGPLIFVTVDRVLETASGQVDEVRTIVYREAATTPAPDSIPLEGMAGMTPCHDWLPDPVQLFRFSALTWNGHRIHFDLDHCRRVEYYPDLITHAATSRANGQSAALWRNGGHRSARASAAKSQPVRTPHTIAPTHAAAAAAARSPIREGSPERQWL